ncbi:extensin-like domain-containing protein [Microvirga arabica]|uniref:extensin-like domain-containing protein n=1 Tax=Microvirga arabica TaxID=1128671 RepID=UPI00193A2B1E|nr:extensin family protein [Microvirga arabica]MBM1172724.1 extensin family protein [Microvirga arabica]
MYRRGCRAGLIGAVMALWPVLAPAAWAQAPTAPLPPPRPDRPEMPASEPRSENPPPADTPVEKTASDDNSAHSACLDRLTKLGLRFEKRPRVEEGRCSVENPVLLSSLPGGVEVAPASLMACPVAQSLARWMSEVVAPEAERQFQSAPTKLLIGTSYQCRDQRNGAKLSEHALGNGVDIMGFEFAKRSPLAIASQSENSPEATFQSAIQKAACPIFNTVLGPGSDAAHGDHLHLDLRQRKGDYRICQ